MISLLPQRFGFHVCFALALATGAFACDDDSNDEAGDETAGDGDGDASGDGDGDASGDGDGDAVLSYAADVQPIWDANCLTACHSAGGGAVAILDLSGSSYAAVVNVSSSQAPGLSLIEPGNSADSYLIAKLRGTQMAAGGLGGKMPAPAMADPLPEDQIALIEAWVDAGSAP